jgi:hypothetical protein
MPEHDLMCGIAAGARELSALIRLKLALFGVEPPRLLQLVGHELEPSLSPDRAVCVRYLTYSN